MALHVRPGEGTRRDYGEVVLGRMVNRGANEGRANPTAFDALRHLGVRDYERYPGLDEVEIGPDAVDLRLELRRIRI